MNVLPFDQRVRIIACLTDGVGVRATERLTGATKQTILSLLLTVGEGCARLHDRIMRRLQCAALQLDEQWSFCARKEKNRRPEDGDDIGDMWTWVAFDVASRSVVSYLVGKRTAENARALAADLRSRLEGRVFLSSDGLISYPDAVSEAWGADPVDFGQLVKQYSDDRPGAPRQRSNYKGAVPVGVFGTTDPRKINTSYVERSNLTTRLSSKRFTRRSLCFSRSLRHHRAAVALHYARYNLCNIVSTLRTTPALALGIVDRLWGVEDLVRAALAEPAAPPAPVAPSDPRRGQLHLVGLPPVLRLIKGGKA